MTDRLTAENPSIHGTCQRFAEATASVRRAVTFKAWRGNVPVEDCPALAEAENFDEALATILPGSAAKTVVSILREDAGRNEKELRLYQVRTSTKRGFWRDAYDGGRKVFVGFLEGKLIHALPMLAFEPKPPFRITRETTHAEIVGFDPTLVSQ